MFSIILLVLLSVVFAAYLYVKWCYSFWSRHGVPFVEPQFPFGNLKTAGQKEHMSTRMAKFYNETKNKKSPITGMYFFLWPSALVTDLKFAQKVLIKEFNHFGDRGSYYNEKADPLSAHLDKLESVKWRSLRSKLSQTFTSGKMKFMFPTIVSVANELVVCLLGMLKTGNEIEIRDLLSRFATDVIGTCAFGIECNSLKDPNTKFRRMGKRVFEDAKRGFITERFLAMNKRLAHFLGLRLHHRDVTEFFSNIVQQTIDYREQNNVQRKDFMDLLIQLKNDGRLKDEAHTGTGTGTGTVVGRLTVNEITAQAFVFFLAGLKTISSALTFALYELAQPHNEPIQDRARDEIITVLAKYGGQLTYEGLNEMPYVEQVINESLRKYPPGVNLSRIVTKDYECTEAGVVLRKGLSIIIPVYAIHHDPDIYEQPEEFRPERFSAGEIKKRPNGSFLPFGDGPRNCIGLRFGMLEVRIALVMLLKHFKFSTCDRTPPMPMPINPRTILLSPLDGVWLNIQSV